MSIIVQYAIVVLVLLAAIALFIGVSIKRDKHKANQSCDDISGCASCADGCSLKKDILEKSAEKRLHQPK